MAEPRRAEVPRRWHAIAAFLVALYLRAVFLTSRWQFENEAAMAALAKSGEGFIVVFWHGQMMAMARICRPIKGAQMLVSAHRDGALIARLIEGMGFSTIRGSTARLRPGALRAEDKGGAQALRAMVRVLKAGGITGITPDGPRGPRMRVSPGAIVLGQLAGVPLLAIGTAYRPRLLFSSWDRFALPLPFARFRVAMADPIRIPRALDDHGVEQHRRALEDTLNALTRRCEGALRLEPVEPAAERAL